MGEGRLLLSEDELVHHDRCVVLSTVANVRPEDKPLDLCEDDWFDSWVGKHKQDDEVGDPRSDLRAQERVGC